MATFFQASQTAAEMLVSEVNEAAGETALSGGYGMVVDAYGGGGLFSATLLDNNTKTTLIESNPSACSDARRNLFDYNVKVDQISVEQWSPQLA